MLPLSVFEAKGLAPRPYRRFARRLIENDKPAKNQVAIHVST